MKTKKKVKPQVGRPTKLTDEMIEIIATALSNGLTRETAARIAHISYQSFFEWRRKGLEEKERRDAGKTPIKKDEIYLNFFNQIEEAETDAIQLWQDTINKAARTDPIWAEKMLKLRDAKGYNPQTPINLTADLDLSKLNLSDEQLQRIVNGESIAEVIANPATGGGSAPATPAAKPNNKPASGG